MSFLNKYWWVLLILVVFVGYLGYRGRHRIETMLGISSAPATATVTHSIYRGSSPSTTGVSGNIYTTKTDPTKGSYLADFQGMSLYVFDNDLAGGVSTCYDACAAKWPAYSSGAAAQGSFPTNISVMTRTDGSTQFAWKGRPLYYYSLDQKAGDVLGDGVGGIWHLAKP